MTNTHSQESPVLDPGAQYEQDVNTILELAADDPNNPILLEFAQEARGRLEVAKTALIGAEVEPPRQNIGLPKPSRFDRTENPVDFDTVAWKVPTKLDHGKVSHREPRAFPQGIRGAQPTTGGRGKPSLAPPKPTRKRRG